MSDQVAHCCWSRFCYVWQMSVGPHTHIHGLSCILFQEWQEGHLCCVPMNRVRNEALDCMYSLHSSSIKLAYIPMIAACSNVCGHHHGCPWSVGPLAYGEPLCTIVSSAHRASSNGGLEGSSNPIRNGDWEQAVRMAVLVALPAIWLVIPLVISNVMFRAAVLSVPSGLSVNTVGHVFLAYTIVA